MKGSKIKQKPVQPPVLNHPPQPRATRSTRPYWVWIGSVLLICGLLASSFFAARGLLANETINDFVSQIRLDQVLDPLFNSEPDVVSEDGLPPIEPAATDLVQNDATIQSGPATTRNAKLGSAIPGSASPDFSNASPPRARASGGCSNAYHF